MPGTADPKRVWRIHSCFGPERLEGRAVEAFVQRVEARGGGDLTMALYRFGTSGIPDADLLRVVSSGGLEMATLYSEYFIRDAPALSLCYVQGVLETAEEHWRAFPAVAAIYRETFDAWNIETIGALARPVYDACLFSPEPVRSLVALAGRKIRVWSRHQVDSFAKLGLNAVIVPQNAMVEAFRQGVIDCALYMAEAAATTSLASVAPYYSSLHPFSAIPNVLGAGRPAWHALGVDLQAVIAEAGRWTAETTLADALALRPADPPSDSGFVRIEPFGAEDRARFREAAGQAWAELAEAAGPTAIATRERVLAALAGQTSHRPVYPQTAFPS